MVGFERSWLSIFLASLLVMAAFLAPSQGWATPEPGRDGIVGTWLTAKADSKVSIYPCGADAYCGRLVWIKDSVDAAGNPYRDTSNPDAGKRNRPVRDLEIMTGLRAKGKAKWDEGLIYDPESGKTYQCKAELAGPDRLSLRGFVGISLLGRSEIWTRVP